MVRFLILFFLCCLFVSAPSLAMQPNGCPDYVEPNIAVKQLVSTPAFNNQFDLAQVRKLAIEGGQNISGSKHETPVGLTSASLKLDSRFDIRVTQEAGDPMVCAQISGFNLNFGFDDTVIYLANELPYNSCPYHTVLEHEMNHVRTDRYLVQSYVPLLPNILRGALKQIGVIRASSPEVAEKQIRTTISKYMGGLGQNLSQVRRNYQMKIDTPEEYDRLSKSCNSDLADIIRKAREIAAQN